MVRAILEGRKTVTRRVVKPQPLPGVGMVNAAYCGRPALWLPEGPVSKYHGKSPEWTCPYGRAGDRLWVKETFWAWGEWTVRYDEAKGRKVWAFVDRTLETGRSYGYDADSVVSEPTKREAGRLRWWRRPALFMPRRASRITLERIGTSAEPLHTLAPEGVVAEGILGDTASQEGRDRLRASWRELWMSINGTESWDSNPWVWVVEFRRIEGGGHADRA